MGTDQDFPALLWVEYHLTPSSPLQTPTPVEVTSEASLQIGLSNLHTKMKQLIDAKYYSFNGLTDEAIIHLANLAKSIQFFPSAIAAGAPVASMRKDTPVSVSNSAYQCTGKYPITVTTVTSDKVNNILIYRSQYQFAPGVSLIAKMQFDSSVSNGNACDINKIHLQKDNKKEFSLLKEFSPPKKGTHVPFRFYNSSSKSNVASEIVIF